MKSSIKIMYGESSISNKNSIHGEPFIEVKLSMNSDDARDALLQSFFTPLMLGSILLHVDTADVKEGIDYNGMTFKEKTIHILPVNTKDVKEVSNYAVDIIDGKTNYFETRIR